MLNRESSDHLLKVVNVIVGDRNVPIIVTFADNKYCDVVRNWHAAISKLNITNYIVIALDVEAFKCFKQHNIYSICLPMSIDNLSALWEFRLNVLQTINTKFDLIHSDADAIWLRDPIPEYFINSPYDFMCSQGTTYPQDIFSHWGFVLCCGFFYVKCNERTQKMFEHLVKNVANDKDDQITLNKYFKYTLNINWTMSNFYKMPISDTLFTCSEKLIVGNGTIKTAILPHHLFQRLEIDISPEVPFVKHILSQKNNQSKLEMFKETNCYFLE
jgi:hypothetical protein